LPNRNSRRNFELSGIESRVDTDETTVFDGSRGGSGAASVSENGSLFVPYLAESESRLISSWRWPVEYVWGVVDHVLAEEPEFVVLLRESAEEVVGILRLFEECSTWGDLQRKSDAKLYAEILGMAGYGEFGDYAAHLLVGREIPGALAMAAAEFDPDQQPPGADEPFLPFDQIGAAADGDYPPDPRYLMNLQVPGDIVDAHGERFESVFNGTYARFPASAVDAVISELERRGHTCVADTTLLTATFKT
jgi:hypothetical protein